MLISLCIMEVLKNDYILKDVNFMFNLDVCFIVFNEQFIFNIFFTYLFSYLLEDFIYFVCCKIAKKFMHALNLKQQKISSVNDLF